MKKLFFMLFLLAALTAAAQVKYDIDPVPAGMVIAGKTLYMTSGKDVIALDISNPEDPVIKSRATIGNFPQSLALSKDGKTLYAADAVRVVMLDLQLKQKGIKTVPGSPVDVAVLPDGKVAVAARKGGVVMLENGAVRIKSPWARSLYVQENGKLAVCSIDSVDFEGDAPIRINCGTPRRIRRLSDGTYCLANGFNGFAILPSDTKSTNPVQPLFQTKDLNRFSCYGAHVYDVLELKEKTLLLAAGEIGIITVTDRNLSNDCIPLRWGHVNGFIRGAGTLLYVSDTVRGLHIMDVSVPTDLKILKTLKLIEK